MLLLPFCVQVLCLSCLYNMVRCVLPSLVIHSFGGLLYLIIYLLLCVCLYLSVFCSLFQTES